MSSERRYSEKEIAAIFEKAAGAQEDASRHVARGEGLTLAELQQIGSEVGISSEFIARAAASVGRSEPVPAPTTYFGVPISVARSVELPSPLSDEDWERVVVDLRETFRARGEVRSGGSVRQWWNGNLHALVEPTETGYRLRLGSLKGSARSALTTGMAAFVMGLTFVLVLAFSGKFGTELPSTIMLSLFAFGGLASMGMVVYSLRRWVEKRGRQMEAVAARALELVAARSGKMHLDAAAAPRLDIEKTEDRVDGAPDRRADKTRS